MTNERFFTAAQLRSFDGDNGPKYIAYLGIVYDVTDCPRWYADLHQNLHFPGLDLTSEMKDAPHGKEVFSRPCVRRVGILNDNLPEENGSSQ